MESMFCFAEQLVVAGYIFVNDFINYGLFGNSIFF